jgi:hypothetical protein
MRESRNLCFPCLLCATESLSQKFPKVQINFCRGETSKFLSFGGIFPIDSTNVPQTKTVFSTDEIHFSTSNHDITGSDCPIGDFAIANPTLLRFWF